MPISKFSHFSAAMLLVAMMLLTPGCRPDPEVTFDLQTFEVDADGADKDRLKTDDQWVSILYANLFQETLAAGDLFEIKQCLESIGDQKIARAVVVSNMMGSEDVILPSIEEMDTDLDAFIRETYVRFLVRYPSEAETTWLANFIENHPAMTPELVYSSFALSDEYLYY
ncbi:MAG: hypothetical protein P8M07_01550 [Flavobacteriales bacterium]|nr:hypothetical protein [Flavobacteriales bacterium]